jgi:hypothetical protein
MDNVMRTKRARRWESRVIPALHMSGLSRLFARSRVLLFGNHASIYFQKSRLAMALAILLRDRLPQPLARLFTPLPNRIRHHLTRLTAQGDLHPRVVRFAEHERPQFVQFQCRGSGVHWTTSTHMMGDTC